MILWQFEIHAAPSGEHYILSSKRGAPMVSALVVLAAGLALGLLLAPTAPHAVWLVGAITLFVAPIQYFSVKWKRYEISVDKNALHVHLHKRIGPNFEFGIPRSEIVGIEFGGRFGRTFIAARTADGARPKISDIPLQPRRNKELAQRIAERLDVPTTVAKVL